MSWNHMVRKALTMHVVIAICLAGSALAQRTVYVDGSVATTGDGTLATPFKTIAEALELTDADLTILVAGGTYADEPNNTDILTGQTLIGSYDGSFTTSDPAATPTIVDMARLTQQEQNGAYTINGASSWTLMNLVIQNSSTGEWENTDNGGAIYIRNGSQGALRGVTFFGCAARFEGGAESGPAREGGALCIRDDSTVLIEDCVFDSCTAVGGGGAIRIRSPRGAGNNVKIHRCLFTRCGSRNSASTIDDGDGASQIEIVNCVFANNGVDVEIPSGVAPSNYEIRVADKRALIYNCTFVGSNNPDGFVFDIGNSSVAGAAKEIVNCIFANNTIASGGSTFAIFSYGTDYDDATTLQNNLFFSNSGLDPLDPAGVSIVGINGNIAGEPQFADAANGDYHLKAGSPGEDAGRTLALVPDDFAGTGRPVGSAYDIGAMEGQRMNPKVRSVMATATSSLNADSGPGKTVDGSGLNALDQHDTGIANMWVSAVGQQPPVRIQYEFDTVYKLDQMWVWNSNSDLERLFLNWGVKTATIEYSTDGATWTALADVPQFAQAPGAAGYAHDTTVPFGGVAARFVRITCTSSWGSGAQYGLSEVRFFYVPVSAREPRPASGAMAVPFDVTLSWKAGCEAVQHNVYLSDDRQAVTDGTAPVVTVDQTAYTPSSLMLGTTYFWRVDEVNQAGIPAVWPGEVWTFTTADYQVVDDFESYKNVELMEIWATWLDGTEFGTNDPTNGSVVGADPAAGDYGPATGRIGGQSLPIWFTNTAAAPKSEAVRTLQPAWDWTRSEIKSLRLWFYGDAGNSGNGRLYVKINNSAPIYYGGDSTDLTKASWQPFNIDLSNVGAGLNNVATLAVGVEGVGATGVVRIDDIRLYRSAPPVNP